MRAVARPILTFLDSMYKPDSPEEAFGRTIANNVTQTTLADVAAAALAPFRVTYSGRAKPKTTVRVQYDAEKADIERIRKQLKKPSWWGATHAGKHTFEHFLKTECPE